MKAKFSVPFLLLLVIFTIILPNHQYITRVKASLILTEWEISSFDTEEILTLSFDHPPMHLCLRPETCGEPLVQLPCIDDKKITNPSLNFLYLAHSPPTYS